MVRSAGFQLTGFHQGWLPSPLPGNQGVPGSRDQVSETRKGKQPYLSNHSPAPPAASQCLLVTTSLGTPARTVLELGRIFGCQGCHSACFLQTTVRRQADQPFLCGTPASGLLSHHIQLDGWFVRACFQTNVFYSFGRSLGTQKYRKQGVAKVPIVRLYLLYGAGH